MTIAYYTDNELSQIVARATGCEMMHIHHYTKDNIIVYGLLRGNYQAMCRASFREKDFYYIDNGYFDAKYVDGAGRKEMTGKFRVVKNDTHDIFVGNPKAVNVSNTILLLPPSPYSAMSLWTTPEDWINQAVKQYPDAKIKLRNKGTLTLLDDDIKSVDAVYAFNSIAVMRAIELGKPVRDDYGCFRNGDFHKYDYQEVRNFYEPKQYTLEQLKDYPWN